MTTPSRSLSEWFAEVDGLLATSEIPEDVQCRPSTSDDVLPHLWASVPVERDLCLEIRRGFIFGTEFVQLAEYLPSAGAHADTVLVPAALFGDVVHQLVDLAREVSSWRSGR